MREIPPSYTFIDFTDRRDSQDVIRDLDGKYNWRIGFSHWSEGGGGIIVVVIIVMENLVVAAAVIVVELILVIARVQVSIPLYHSSLHMYSYILS